MKKALSDTLKFIIASVLVIVSFIVATIFYEFNHGLSPEKMCGTKPGPVALSPDNKFKAVVYEFDCGAMDPFSTQISILTPDESIPLKGGNVFGATRGGLRGSWDGPYVEVEWLSSDNLKVRYIGDADIQFKKTSVNNIKISYEIYR